MNQPNLSDEKKNVKKEKIKIKEKKTLNDHTTIVDDGFTYMERIVPTRLKIS